MTQLMFRIDELEGNKTKLQMRLQEAEETIDSLHTKVTLRYGHLSGIHVVCSGCQHGEDQTPDGHRA